MKKNLDVKDFFFKWLCLQINMAQRRSIELKISYLYRDGKEFLLKKYESESWWQTLDDFRISDIWNKWLIYQVDVFSENKLDFLVDSFFSHRCEKKTIYQHEILRWNSLTYTAYNTLEHFLVGLDQGSMATVDSASEIFCNLAYLNNYALTQKNSLFYSAFQDTKSAFSFKANFFYFTEENLFLFKSAFEEKLWRPIVEQKQLTLEEANERYQGKRWQAWSLMMYYGLNPRRIFHYNDTYDAYKRLYFFDLQMSYKGVKIKVPSILQIASEHEVSYARKIESFKQQFSDQPFPIILSNFQADSYYDISSIAGLGLLGSFFFKENIRGIRAKHETVNTEGRSKNQDFYIGSKDFEFIPFNQLREKSYRPGDLGEAQNHVWDLDTRWSRKGYYRHFLSKVPILSFDARLQNTYHCVELYSLVTVKNEGWCFIHLNFNCIWFFRISLFLAYLKRKFSVFNISALEHLRIKELKNSFDSSTKKLIEFLATKTAAWIRIYFLKQNQCRNSYHRDLFFFFQLKKKSRLKTLRRTIAYELKKLPVSADFPTNVVFSRLKQRNWIPSDLAFVRSRCQSVKFFTQISNLTSRNIDDVLFKEKEPLRIYRSMQALNSYYLFGREFLTRNYNHIWSELFLNPAIDFILQDNLKFYNPKLPFSRKKKKIFSIIQDWHQHLAAMGYSLVNCKHSARFVPNNVKTPLFGINFSNNVFPFFRGFPSYGAHTESPVNLVVLSLLRSNLSEFFQHCLSTCLAGNVFSPVLASIKWDPQFFSSRFLFSPRSFSVHSHFLQQYFYQEKIKPGSVSLSLLGGAIDYFQQFKVNSVFYFPRQQIGDSFLMNGVGLFLSLFNCHTPGQFFPKNQRRYNKDFLRFRRSDFLKRKHKKEVTLINQGALFPDFMNLFKSHSRGYFHLNPAPPASKKKRSKNTDDFRKHYWDKFYPEMRENYFVIEALENSFLYEEDEF